MNVCLTFLIQDTGDIVWDYRITSVPVYQYQDYNINLRIFLEIICVVFLVVNCLSEAAGLHVVLFFVFSISKQAAGHFTILLLQISSQL